MTKHRGGRAPSSVRRKGLNLRLRMRRPTAGRRRLPDFLIIGAQRAGTSSLYKYLGQHPLVVPSLRKETEYFSRRYGNGISWYRAHFPLQLTSRGTGTRCFEATPDYLYWPTAPVRAADTVSDARFIVLLRDPVERAYSHYEHMVRLGFETWSFEKAIDLEEERIADDRAALEENLLHYARPLLRFSYCSRGRYAEQLERWFAVFPRDRFLVVFSDDLFADPAGTYGRILEFLDLPPFSPQAFPNYSYRGRPRPNARLDDTARVALRARFSTADSRLADLLEREVPWAHR